MPISSTTFNYNVAKIIDTPWNTIVNGLNYTKQNLAPLSLKYTTAQNYDCGMLLKEIAGNSIQSSVPVEDFSFNNAVRDYDDSNKYWILNTCHKTRNNSGPFMYCASKYIDDNGFEFSEINDAYVNNSIRCNCSSIWYQDSSYMYVYLSDMALDDTSSSSSTKKYSYIRRFKKDGTRVTYYNEYSHQESLCKLLMIENGFMYYLTLGQYNYLYKLEISSGIRTQITSYGNFNSNGVLTSYPSNIIDGDSFFMKNMYNGKIYKFTLNDSRTTISLTEMIKSQTDSCNYDSSSYHYHGHLKNFMHIYEENGEQYLASMSLNSYSYTTDSSTDKSHILLYRINGTNLELIQDIKIAGLSIIPKNDWNTIFVGCSAGLKSFTWDSYNKKFIENPQLVTSIQQWGFDIDERLWILDGAGSLIRYTYNQPVTVEYNFEKERYYLGTEPIETYVDVKVLNYMSDNLTSSIKLKAVGNFTFINNQKELEITLSSEGYTRLPVYIFGSGKYEIKI